MARIRTIKPSFWTDDKVVNLSRDARLLLIGMISHADDEGRLPASPAALIGAIYPQDEVTPAQVKKWRDEIDKAGVAQIYAVGKATYAELPNWRRHQVINKKTNSNHPARPQDTLL